MFYGRDGYRVFKLENMEEMKGQEGNRRVRLHKGSFGMISSVFLISDHGWPGSGGPVLWELLYEDSDGGEVDLWRFREPEDLLKAHYDLLTSLVS